MALQMERETPDGVLHPASYWRVVEVNLDVEARRVEVIAAGYHSSAAAAGGRAQIERRDYLLRGADALPLLQAARGALAGVTAIGAAYAAVKAAKDVEGPAGADGEPTHEGFFDTARDV